MYTIAMVVQKHTSDLAIYLLVYNIHENQTKK